MTLSPEQLELRREGITATDMAALMLVHPFRKPIDVFDEKMGTAPLFVEKQETKWGHLLEPVVIKEYEERRNVRIRQCGTLRSRRKRWALATPDGLVYPYGSSEAVGGFEVKCHGDDVLRFGPGFEYGPEGTDEVPHHELIQCMWGVFVAELPRWDLTMFNQRPREYVIDQDDELIGMMVETGERFMRDHVQTKRPPDPDGSKSWDQYIKRKWTENDDRYIQADRDPALLALIQELKDSRASLKDAEVRASRAAQKIKNAIGDKAGISFYEPDRAKAVRIHFKHSKQSHQEQWKASFMAVREKAALLVSGRRALADRIYSELVSRGAIGEIATLLQEAFATLGDIAIAEVTTTPKAIARPLFIPRHWPKTAGDDKTDDDKEN